ncbi:MAG TPA: hypothetical protein VIT22_04880 [Pseudoxanthomonas sp.]
MKNTMRAFCVVAVALALAVACKREAPVAAPEPATDATAAPIAEANPVDATSVVENTPAADSAIAALDGKALAGKFGDGESVLELRADGSYVQTLQAGGSSISTDGSWSASGVDTLLLDPNSKSAQDAQFVVVSNDELRTADGARTFRRITGQ